MFLHKKTAIMNWLKGPINLYFVWFYLKYLIVLVKLMKSIHFIKDQMIIKVNNPFENYS